MSYTHYIPEDPLLTHEFEETWCSMSEPLLSQSMVPPRYKQNMMTKNIVPSNISFSQKINMKNERRNGIPIGLLLTQK